MFKCLNTTTGEILNDFKTILSAQSPTFDNNQPITRITSIADSDEKSLVFIYQKTLIQTLPNQPPAMIITSHKLVNKILNLYDNSAELNIATANNPRLAMALIRTALDDYQVADTEWPLLHPTAQINASATLGDGVRIGPGAVVGANVSIGDECIVKSNAVIEHNVVLGKNCVIHAGVNIGYGCVVGNCVTIKANSVIGMEGFGFVEDEQRHHYRIPHTGRVIIEDDVVISALCNIDRGTMENTTIRTGARIDAMVHIAHNVEIGEHTLIIAQSGISGSSSIGNHVILSGQTGILDHKTITDNVLLLHRAGVMRDITKPGTYFGNQAQSMREYLADMQLMKKVKKLEKRLAKLEKKNIVSD